MCAAVLVTTNSTVVFCERHVLPPLPRELPQQVIMRGWCKLSPQGHSSPPLCRLDQPEGPMSAATRKRSLTLSPPLERAEPEVLLPGIEPRVSALVGEK